MRIISGKARGTKLYTLEGIQTRPTLDRVKESFFNIINDKIQDAIVLDMFSGSGAIGLEFLSRGAKQVIACDNSKKAFEIILKNIEKTKLTNIQVINKDYKKALEDIQKQSYKFDIIYIDPPYKTDYAIHVIQQILEKDLLNKDGIAVIETDNEEEIVTKLKNIDIQIYDIRKYGRVKLIFTSQKEAKV